MVASVDRRAMELVERTLSQSPSLRGSGRFILPSEDRQGGGKCLNPLHCGAVVASSLKTDVRRVGG